MRTDRQDPVLSATEYEALRSLIDRVEQSNSSRTNLAPVHASGLPAETVVLARKMKAARNLRSDFIESSLLGEPAWDILLSVYIAHGEGYRLKIGDVVEQSGAPFSTALRWIERLIDHDYLVRRRNDYDARSSFIEASDRGIQKIELALHEINNRFLQAK